MIRLWPKRLAGQMFLTIAVALFVAQAVNAVLLYRGQTNQMREQVSSAAAFRLLATAERLNEEPEMTARWLDRRRDRPFRRIQLTSTSPVEPEMAARPWLSARVGEILTSYSAEFRIVEAAEAPVPPRMLEMIARSGMVDVGDRRRARTMMVVAMQRPDGQWLSARVPVPPRERSILAFLAMQTLFLYLVLLGATYWLTRRASRPLDALGTAVSRFRQSQVAEPVEPGGPEDVSRLIEAFNAMSSRIAAMLDEKDVMLGAIGHDLKTPLAALRVRVESIADQTQRDRMVASIDEIVRTLDDILSLARIGRTTAQPESVNVGALAETVADELSDLGHDVTVTTEERIVARLHIVWFLRALRNLVSNAVRYGERARIALALDGDALTVRVEDDGPGIAEDRIEDMFKPFQRLEGSRNTRTGGSGIGLTLVRAIAEQHGGAVTLANRHDASGRVVGLAATLTLPLDRDRPTTHQG